MRTLASRITLACAPFLACLLVTLAFVTASPSSANECNAGYGALNGRICIQSEQNMKIAQRACKDADKGGQEARLACQNAFSDCQNAIANSTVQRGSSKHIAMIRNCTAQEKACKASYYFNDERCVKRAG